MSYILIQIRLLIQRVFHKFGYHLGRLEKLAYIPSGHFHSPIPSKEEIIKRQRQIFEINKKEIDGVDLKEEEQVDLLEKLARYYKELPFTENKKEGLRYYYNNNTYTYSDAIFLYSVIRHCRPGKYIEIGSGYSSCVMLDTNELYLQNRCKCCFIEPYPKRLLSVLKESDLTNHEIVRSFVQDVDLDIFKQLQENDILFIDSSHVAKTGSDVNHIFFEILPRLNKGVLIHFHDISYPFEYSEEAVLIKRLVWNEAYMLRAFLQYNTRFEIILFNTFLEYYYKDWFNKNMPLCLKNWGASIWLRKV